MTAVQSRPAPDMQRPTPAGTRFVDVRANLLPVEVLSARQTDVMRRRILLGLAGLAALLVFGFGASWLQTHASRSDLTDLNGAIANSKQAQGRYGKLAAAQDEVRTTRTRLAQLMTGDLSWNRVLAELRAAAPSGVTFTSVDGSVTSTTGTQTGAAPAPGAATTVDPLNTSGNPVVGSLAITGTARDSAAVAKLSDALGKVKGVTSVMITNVASGKDGTTFSLTASLTSTALGGRFDNSGSTKGGK